MPQKEFLLTIVRHGEATHNTDGVDKTLKFTDEANPVLDSPLTDKGRNQAVLVGNRLKNINFDLVISSDLRRAHDTASAILAASNHEEKKLLLWKVARERNIGDFLKSDAYKSQFTVEAAVKDRELLTWRIPGGGESVVDLRERVRQFLLNVQAAVTELAKDSEEEKEEGEDRPNVLVVSHGLFMNELHHVLTGEEVVTNTYKNTGMAQYLVQGVEREEGGKWVIGKVDCRSISSDSHLSLDSAGDL